MSAPESNHQRTWYHRFRDAFRGVRFAVVGSPSFYAHILMTLLVILCGWLFSVTRLEWCLLLLCVGLVTGLEAVNSAIEVMAKLVDPEHNPQIGKALDMSSGGVLLAGLASAVVGLLIFLPKLMAWL